MNNNLYKLIFIISFNVTTVKPVSWQFYMPKSTLVYLCKA